MFVGPSADGRQFLLVTKRIYGRQLTEHDSLLLPAALSALRSVHAAGICHGDVRLPNFIVETHGPATVRLVDRDMHGLCLSNTLMAPIGPYVTTHPQTSLFPRSWELPLKAPCWRASSSSTSGTHGSVRKGKSGNSKRRRIASSTCWEGEFTPSKTSNGCLLKHWGEVCFRFFVQHQLH